MRNQIIHSILFLLLGTVNVVLLITTDTSTSAETFTVTVAIADTTLTEIITTADTTVTETVTSANTTAAETVTTGNTTVAETVTGDNNTVAVEEDTTVFIDTSFYVTRHNAENVNTTSAIVYCPPFTDISSINRRVSYYAADGNYLSDSNLTYDWYYLGKLGIPQSCPELYSCGTLFPIWSYYVWGYPAHGSTSYAYLYKNSYPDGCYNYFAYAQVKNCFDSATNQNKIIYQLFSTDIDSAYCQAEDTALCPAGELYNAIANNCSSSGVSEIYSIYLSDPVITNTTTNTVGQTINMFSYNCVINAEDNPSARMNVRFFAGNQVIKTVEGANSQTVQLEENYLIGHIGQMISCEAVRYSEGSLIKTRPKRSNFLSAKFTLIDADYGWEMYWYYVYMSTGRSKTLRLKLPFPATTGHCFSNLTVPCETKYSVGVSSLVVKLNKGCQYTTIDNMGQFYEDIIITSPVALRGGGFYSYGTIEFNNKHKNDPNHILFGVEFPAIWIYIFYYPEGCWSTGDPYIYNFFYNFFSLYESGEFYLLRSINEGDFNEQEVISQQYRCFWAISCTCGVWVREGNNLVGINMCDGNGGVSFPPTFVRYLTDPDDPDVRMETTDWGWSINYKVQMPSGMRVTVGVNRMNMNILVAHHVPENVSSIYSGLCYMKNDLSLCKHKVPSWNSYMYSGHAPKCNPNIRPKGISTTSLVPDDCFCLSNNGTTETQTCVPAASADQYPLILTTGIICESRVGRKKRATTTDNIIQLKFDYTYEYPSYTPWNGVATWPTKSGITLKQANQTCYDQITGSPSYGMCPELDYSDITKSCIADLYAADDLSLANQYRGRFQSSCKFAKQKQIIETRLGPNPPTFINGTDIFSLQLEQIQILTCPNNCSEKGNCFNDKCTCNLGYYGDDCSTSITDVPSYSLKESSCDYKTTDCSDVMLEATKIIANKTICKIEKAGATSKKKKVPTATLR